MWFGAAIRRLILPAMLAIGVAGTIEVAIDLRYRPDFWQKTPWLMHDPYKGELFDRVEIYIRLHHLEDSDPEVISVGDSSGFFSLQSTIVNRYTHGHKFLSLNTGVNQAYIGYQAIAEYMLRRSKHIKYVVLYLFPQLLPQESWISHADLGPITEDSLVSLKSYLTPPSAFLSPYAKFRLFEGRHFRASDPLTSHTPSLQLGSTVHDALGWLPEFDVRYDRVDGRTPFGSDTRSGWYNQLGLTDRSAINANLNDFYKVVRSYGAQLVVAFAPMQARGPVPGDPYIPIAEQALDRFQREHPDVKFLFPLVTRWGSEKFGMYNHISREYTFLSSERLGKALGRLVTNPDSIPPFVAQFKDVGSYPAITAMPQGELDPNLLKPALALYLYTSTNDNSYRQLISKRVLDLLDNEPSFQYMMADASIRVGSLAKRNIKIGFDLSQLRATPVAITGLPHCYSQHGTQWVQLDGTMIFTYASPTIESKEPVAWPSTSHVFIPTIVEDGIRKFDGYCPELSLNDATVAGQ
jgi:hypothetical protein